MDTSIKWIKDLVPGLECTNQEFRDAMTLSGTKVGIYCKQQLVDVGNVKRN